MTFAALATMPFTVPGLAPDDQDVFTGLLNQIVAKSARNQLRQRYYDGKNVLRDLGISIPPSMRTLETVIGWPAKGVDVLARRVQLQSFYLTSGSLDGTGFDELLVENRVEVEAPQAHTSALVMSPAYVCVTAGDVPAGEPAVLVSCRSALHAAGAWDQRLRGLSSALSIISTDPTTGAVTEFVLYRPNRAIIGRRSDAGAAWDLRMSVHDLGVPVEPLTFRPSLDRPLGRSRVTRGVMSITDRAVRTAVRTEVSAEFFSAPQRYALGGAGQDAFTDDEGNAIPGWVSLIGRILAIGKDEDGDVPTVGTFPQLSMVPHLDMMRELASEMAAETDLMPDTLGVLQDNPSSAEAIDARKEELRLTAESCIATFGAGWERTARTMLRMLDDSPAARAQWANLRSRWRNPATPSMAAAADSTVKLVAAGVFPAASEVTYVGLSLSEDQRAILRADARRARSFDALEALTGRAAAGAVA